jgi:hypothetical protein
MWGNMNNEYGKLAKGYSGNISGMTSASRGFTGNRLLGYPESHDEDRLMYYNKTAGNSTNAAHNVKDLNVGLSRMSAIGAISLLIPGPKMIWHFGELGWDSSIFTCTDGSVNDNSSTIAGDCKLSTKPQPQWTNNWLADNSRNKIYTDWTRMIALKTTEPVFSGVATITNTSSLTSNIKITNSALPSTDLKDVLLLANFDVTSQNVAPGFPYIGTWYNLMDNSSINVTDVTAPIAVMAGDFKIYGNKKSNLEDKYFTLPTDNFTIESKGETCVNQNNGEIVITAKTTHAYTAIVNGKAYDFVNNSLKISSLPATTYNVSISVMGESTEQKFTIGIPKGGTITGKSSLNSDKLLVEINNGTAPYTIFINGQEQFETNSEAFLVDTNKGGLLEVKTAKACEGVYSTQIDDSFLTTTAYPNPTTGKVALTLPTSKKEVTVSIYTLNSQVISTNTYPVENGQVQLNLENQTNGIYMVKVNLETPTYLKIIKN